MLRVAAIPLAAYLILVIGVWLGQRSLLFFPSHAPASSNLLPWLDDNKRVIGYSREVTNSQTIWLMTHGNAGQAADRDYVLSRMSAEDSLYVLEYPGYGQREGTPSLESINQAASEAYRLLRSRNPSTPVCVLGESIGTGPACALARENPPPDKIALVVPFDLLSSVASERFYFLPVRLLLRDRWDNIDSLKGYSGPVDIFGATRDDIIPVAHAKALAKQIPKAHFTEISGGHNDWSANTRVQIKR